MLTLFITSILVMCAITVTLTVLLLLAETFLADYGPVNISINGKNMIEADGGASLLQTLQEKNIFIPSACGGRGSCGLCKIKVTSGAGPILPTETPWLSAEDIANGVRLACQLKLRNDVSIQVPEEILSVRRYETTVSSIRNLTHDIKEIRLRLPPGETMAFTAGQYIQIEVPPYQLTSETVYRAYSISSPPSGNSEIELEIRYVPNGICTTYVHQYLKAGDTLALNGPYGDFRLSDSESDIIFIAGGSGMAPIKSILLDMLEKNIRRKSSYFFGARSKRDLFLTDEMRSLETSLHDFKFIPALSEPAPEDNWQGETGLITEVIRKSASITPATEAYLCGSPLMIEACIKVLGSLGVDKNRIFYDKFS